MNLLSRIMNKLPKRLLATAGLIALAIALPATSLAADKVQLEGTIGVANATVAKAAGKTLTYTPSTNASYDQVVKVEVYYHNKELPNSGKIANNLNVKINIPTGAGKTQTISETTKADNADPINSSATVNLDGTDAYLQYIPGSAVWKHNVGTNDNTNYVETKISDNIVTGGQGLTLEDEKPCYNFSATVTVQARVMVPGVKIVKQVEKANQTGAYATQINANPGDVLRYRISYTNTGNTMQKNVVIRDNLPKGMTLVPNTTRLTNDTKPAPGALVASNDVVNGGLIIGNYAPSTAPLAYVTFEVQVPAAEALKCGNNEFINVGVVRPEGMNEYYNTANVEVNKTCVATPAYTCDAFDITADNASRKVTVSNFAQTASNGATFKDAVINWGDNSAELTTNTVTGQTHSYTSDGTYTVTATTHFTVNGADVTASGTNCTKSVTFKQDMPPVITTASTPTTTPTKLVNTGPGQVIGLFVATTIAGMVAYRSFLSRRFTQN